MGTLPRKKFLLKLMRWNADGQNDVHQGNSSVQAVHLLASAVVRVVVLSSATERPETELSLQPWGFCDRG